MDISIKLVAVARQREGTQGCVSSGTEQEIAKWWLRMEELCCKGSIRSTTGCRAVCWRPPSLRVPAPSSSAPLLQMRRVQIIPSQDVFLMLGVETSGKESQGADYRLMW